jgi:hypothetical protein
LRSRTGLLLTGASIATSLMGAPALKNGEMGGLSWMALLAFAGVVAASLWIVLPRRKRWSFALGAQVLVEDWVDEPRCGDATEMKKFLASTLARNYDRNQELLESLYTPFTFAAFLLGLEILAWAIHLA